MTTTLPVLVRAESSAIDAVTARAVRLALRPELAVHDAALELIGVAGGSERLLDATCARVERALASEWSKVGARAAADLRAALAHLRRA